jgi:Coenzyme PQQ synthesis protein D (PqqD)
MFPNSRFRVNSPRVVHETIDGEVVMINLDTGCYYSLDNVGAAIWNRLDSGASLGEMVAWLASSYPSDRQEVEAAVEQLVTELQSEELIRGLDGQAAGRDGARHDGARGEPAVAPAVFETPVLHKHTDMQDLLLLDPIHEVDETGWPTVKKDPPR